MRLHCGDVLVSTHDDSGPRGFEDGQVQLQCEEGSILAGIGKERAIRDIEVWNGKDI